MPTDPPIDANPYQPPEPPVGPALELDAAEANARAARLANLKSESAVRSVGRLLLFLALPAGAAFGLMSLMISDLIRPTIHPREAWTLGVVALGVAPVLGLLGFGLVRLWAWARWATILLLGLLLSETGSRLLLGIYFPFEFRLGEQAAIATLAARLIVQLYLIALLIRPSRGRVCRRDYRAVVRATPGVRCPTTRGVLALMGVAAGVATLAAVAILTHPPISLPAPPAPPTPPPGVTIERAG